MPEARRVPELLLPAGGFDAAVAAIEGGADALYLGFADFSARKQARNFDRLEYRRLLGLARARGIRLYAAINTVILDAELDAAAGLLAFLGRFPPDAVIVQDWGLARLIRARHPGIEIHASTQTATQGAAGLRIAAELGASRVVLPRETPLARIRKLREECPEVELETFVHGAHCYSYSGLCLASGLLLGRSGNRGECAQVCRSYYDAEPAEGFAGGRGYWFSCRDLNLSERVAELAEAGVRSFKVEGRMKSPEYCFAVARLYRAAIDGLPAEELRLRAEAASIAFSREGTTGWLFGRGGERLIDAGFPGHRGSLAGRILKASGGRATVELSSSLGLRDGLLAFEGQDSAKPLQFSVTGLTDARSGRPLSSARPGDRVELDCPGSPRAGSELRRISDRRMDRPAASPEEYPPATTALPLRLKLEGSLSAELGLPSFDGRGGTEGVAPIEAGEPLKVEAARSPGGFIKALALFAEGGEADFRLVPRGGLEELADLFIPPSALKREKNRIYSRAAAILAERELEYARGWPRDASLNASRPRGDTGERPRVEAPPRARLAFPQELLPAGMPFATPRILREKLALPEFGGASWLPLAPLACEVEEYEELARARILAELSAGSTLFVGVSSTRQVALARRLVDEAGEGLPRLAFFLDVHLYVANRLALAAYDSLVPRLAFAYAYLEAPFEPAIAALPGLPPLAPVGEGFTPPLFLSLGCLKKHHACGGSCPPDCGKRWAMKLADRDRRYAAIVEDCVSMLFRLA